MLPSSEVAMRPMLPLSALLLLGCPDQSIKVINSPPEATIVSHRDGDTVEEGASITVSGIVSDADHAASELAASWTLGGVEACPESTPDENGATSCTLEMGEDGAVTLQVQDPQDATAVAAIELQVQLNQPPQADISAPEEGGVYYSDHKITLAGTVQDDEDEPDALLYDWESDLDGTVVDQGAPDSDGAVSDAVYLSEGEHQLTLTAWDSAGKTGSDALLVTVGEANSAPTCTITSPESGTAGGEGDLVQFEAQVGDANIAPHELSIQWESDKDGELGASTATSAGEVVFAFSDLSVDTHTVTLTVTDEVDEACTDLVVYTVGTAPAVSFDEPAGEVVAEGAAVSFSATVSDGEDAPSSLQLEWSSSLDGLFSTQGADSGGSASFTTSDLSLGEHALTLTVTDSQGLWSSATSSVTVNGQPTAPVVSLGPDPATTGDDLVVTIETASSDPEDDAVSYTYAWYLDSALSGASTATTLPASATTRGDTWSVEVSASDGVGSSEAGTASLTIGNSAPVVSSVILSPSSVQTDDLLTASPSASDDDGDTVSYAYAWYVDGALAASGSASLDGGAYFDKDQEVHVVVTPSDGTEDGASANSSTITVLNTAPTAPTISIEPAEPSEGVDDLVCTIDSDSTDADGDGVSYTFTWTVDGTIYPDDWDTGFADAGWTGPDSTTHTDDTVPAEDTIEGETWTCTVTPDDGDDTGTDATDSVTIEAAVSDCPVASSYEVIGGPADEYGFCWYLGYQGLSCDTVCGAMGADNLAWDAESAYADSCSRASSTGMSAWFFNNGNPGSWTGAASVTTGHGYGYGYVGSGYYGKCTVGTDNIGTYPGETAPGATRQLVCVCGS